MKTSMSLSTVFLIHELDRETNTRKIEIHYSFVGQVDTEQEPTQVVNHDRRNMVDVKVSLSNLSKVRTRITVVRVPAQIGKAVLLCIGFKDTLLIGNGIALALQLVLMGKSWVKGGNWLLVGLS